MHVEQYSTVSWVLWVGIAVRLDDSLARRGFGVEFGYELASAEYLSQVTCKRFHRAKTDIANTP